MPKLTNKMHSRFLKELNGRFDALAAMIRRGDLFSSGDPYETNGDSPGIRMAVDDFKTILAEIRRLK